MADGARSPAEGRSLHRGQDTPLLKFNRQRHDCRNPVTVQLGKSPMKPLEMVIKCSLVITHWRRRTAGCDQPSLLYSGPRQMNMALPVLFVGSACGQSPLRDTVINIYLEYGTFSVSDTARCIHLPRCDYSCLSLREKGNGPKGGHAGPPDKWGPLYVTQGLFNF